MRKYSEFVFSDLVLEYFLDDKNGMSMRLLPAEKKDSVIGKACAPEPLAQLHARGDALPGGYGSGHTLAASPASFALAFVSQSQAGDTVETVLESPSGRAVTHRAQWLEGTRALIVSCVFENRGDAPVTLELLSSVNFGGITPFTPGDASGKLFVHRVRSMWSAEGRLQTQSIEDAMLERSWTGHALRLCKFGQVGSMPVRGYFPFAALEDRQAGVTWAMQLACPSSWQMEIRRKDDCLSMMASLADYEFGHWAKTVRPGERFETPAAYVTVCRGGVDQASQRLLTVHKRKMPRPDADLPVLFNEYCTTWGCPDEKTLGKIAACLEGHGVDFLVIDAGWYRGDTDGWSDSGGDWIPNETALFPSGLKAAAQMIRSHGMKPGLWFEPETCARDSRLFHREDMLLRRFGAVLETEGRRFLDMRGEEARDYLRERVIGLLEKCGFDYIKVDYNDCIGVGCDDPDSLGEGLRQNMLGTQRFFRDMRSALPQLWIENCSSGGHRLEPSMMHLSDMASFSDAHECPEIPIIAANLHRMILPAQSQIWAVLQAGDSIRRINYSLVSAFLGVLCLSGDITHLDAAQWAKVDEGVSFYREVRHIIRDGVSAFYGSVSASWRHPAGWQAVVRTAGGESLVLIHTFGGGFPDEITLPVQPGSVRRVMCSEENLITLFGNSLTVRLRAPFEAVAVHLEKK